MSARGGGKKAARKGVQTEEETDDKTRIAIVNADKCKPKKCKQECKRSCPVVRMGKMCIEVTPADKVAFISEELCIGCGICVKKCPFDAISIINLPSNLASETTHRYGPNSFKLHRLPIPRPNEVLGLVGTNGIGKSTALKVLSGKLKPNLGRFSEEVTWEEILRYFRGSELQGYFNRMLEEKVKAVMKPQYVDAIPKALKGKGTVASVVSRKDSRGIFERMISELQLENVRDREVEHLSGGELQRFAICFVCVQNADVYMFDEPTSYLDVKQRLRMSRVVRELTEMDEEKPRFVICVEHDLAVLDYLSDYICCLYGTPGAYGVVTMPFSVREGINVFLAGYIPTENLRFRDEGLKFNLAQYAEEDEGAAPSGGGAAKSRDRRVYPELQKTMRSKKGKQFHLTIEPGWFTGSQIIVMLGENGTGKTTFIKMLAGTLEADVPEGEEEAPKLEGFSVSYKPQKLSPSFEGSVRALLHKKINKSMSHPQFQTDVVDPLMINEIIDQDVRHLSGGELQRVAMCLCLGKPADVYLIDEPSAYLDSEQRLVTAKVIKRFILHAKRTAFVVEHDFIMATYLADRVIVYDGEPGVDCRASSPESLLSGMNRFLAMLEITFRRDPENHRPRINKFNSEKDRHQKRTGAYFFVEEE